MADDSDFNASMDSLPEKLNEPPVKGNKKLSVERVYQKKTQLEHILLRPDTYIGSVEPVTQTMWVYDGEEVGMVNREITFVPGLYKIFDEILVNAADNKQRDKSMNTIKIEINPEENKISIWNNGQGIPVVKHKVEKMFVPSLIFGHLLTSSNYNDEERKVTGGRNGYGAKLCNIFSKKFTVETSSKEQGKYFKQSWSDNMSKASDPKVVDKSGQDYTCVTFYPDLSKFKMEVLDKDIVALMTRRAFDIAGCTKDVKVFLNGKRLPVKNFKEYIELYVKNKEDMNGDPLKVIHEVFSERWEVALTLSEHGFQQVSFVNSIATTKGGRHVDYITDQLTSKIAEVVKKKNKGGKDVRPFQIKTHLWVFVNCLIENPTFDSQTKENMTLQVKSFGSKCPLSEKFINQSLKCGVVEAIMSWVKFKEQTQLQQKCSGKKHSKLKGVPKLEDANDAGTKHSIDCTLILTEGDSAKSLAVSGLGVVGRDKFGVFPLKGKMLNVREASHKQILENAEINNIIKIMGLQYKKKYESIDDLKTLRYGRLMVMADQDQDGSHIKGLLINFIHHNWPSLLRLPFLEEFITPIVKATKGKEEISFYSLPEFEEWKKETPNWPSWKIKYYKGLGTSTSKEAKEYFSDMVRHRIKFKYSGEDDDRAIQLAFSKKLVDMRKEWLTVGMEERKRRRELGLPELYLYGKNTTYITYNDFVNKELILFSNMDNERSIPSLVDGLKPGQRKVLYTCIKRNDKREIKVAQLAGSVAEHSAYHHGEQALNGTIVNLAQNFVGSNNINILQPLGQFGTRLQGGKDSASPRYIFTMLSPLAKHLFSSLDEPLLNHLYDDNQKIEPEYYVPIIPMVLVNGAEGIGTGWSTKIPNYNPRDIIKNIYRLLDGDEPVEMFPWFKGFKGTIDYLDSTHYIMSGEISRLDNNKVEITELPVKVWTQAYKEGVLEAMLHGSDKSPAFITDYKEYNTDTTVRFVVTMTPEKMLQAENQGLHKVFKLQSSLSTSSMVLFDSKGCLRKYDSPDQMLREYFEVRYSLYERRKEYLEGMIGAEVLKLQNQARFILEKIEGKIVIENRKKVDMIKTLQDRNYDSDPVKAWKEAQKESNKDTDKTENSDSEDESATTSGPDYDYLLGMSLWSLTREKKEDLLKKRDDKKKELEHLQSQTAKDLWKTDLQAFLEELDKVEKQQVDDESAQPAKGKGKLGGGGGGRKKKIAEETKPSPFAERVIPRIDSELKKRFERKPAGVGGEEKRGRRKKEEKKEKKNDEEEEEALVPLSERVDGTPKAKETKVKKVKQTTLNFKTVSKKSPSKVKGKPKKNPWSDSESAKSESEASDVNMDDYIPPEKREIVPRRAAAKAKYIFDSDEEKSDRSGSPEMRPYDPEGGPLSDSYNSENDASKVKKPVASKKTKPAARSDSYDSNEDDAPKAKKPIAPKKTKSAAQSDSYDSDGDDAPKAKKPVAPKKTKSAAQSDSYDSDGDDAPKVKKPIAPKKTKPVALSDSYNSDEDDAPKVKKTVAPKKTKPVVKENLNGAAEPALSDSDDSDMFGKEAEKPSDNLFDSLLDGNNKPDTQKVPPQKSYSSDSDSSMHLEVETKKPAVKKPVAVIAAPPRKRPKKKNISSDDDDFMPEVKKSPKKPKITKKKNKNDDENAVSRPPKAKKPKKKESGSEDEEDIKKSDDDSLVIARPRGGGRARAPVKYDFGGDSSDD